MNPTASTLAIVALAASLAAQSVVTYPADYANVPEGPLNSPNLPFADGTSRVLIVYEAWDLPVPVGTQITRLGFRQDATLTAIDVSRSIQLEIRMGNGSQVQFGIQPQSSILVGLGPAATVTTGTVSVRYCPVPLFEYQ